MKSLKSYNKNASYPANRRLEIFTTSFLGR